MRGVPEHLRGGVMSMAGTRGRARGRNLSSGAVFFPKEEKKRATRHFRRYRHLAVSDGFWGGILDGAVPCDSGLASLVQVRRQAVAPDRFPLAQRPGPRTKRLLLEATTELTPVQSRVAATQATITSACHQSENVPTAMRAPECGIVDPLFRAAVILALASILRRGHASD